MRRKRITSFAFLCWLLLAPRLSSQDAGGSESLDQGWSVPPEPVSLDARAMGRPVVLGIWPLATKIATRDALADALEEIQTLGELGDPDGDRPGGLGALNRAAGKGSVALDTRLLGLLERALTFCRWSSQAHGPLGGNLYGLWGLRRPTGGGIPSPETLGREVEKASCDRLIVDSASGTAALAQGSRVDPWGFLEGWAVDRAVEILEDRGATNGWVEILPVVRAFGPGPEQRGWPTAAGPPGKPELEERVYLRDQALAMASAAEGKIEVGGDVYPPYLLQRTGRPVRGRLATLVVTELAVDAQALAATVFVIEPREAHFRLGGLRPRPSVLWLLGEGTGFPLVDQLRWAELEKW